MLSFKCNGIKEPFGAPDVFLDPKPRPLVEGSAYIGQVVKTFWVFSHLYWAGLRYPSNE